MHMPSFSTRSKFKAKRASAPPAAPSTPAAAAAQTAVPKKLYVRALLKEGTHVVHKRTMLSVQLTGASDNSLTRLSQLDGAWDSLVQSGQVVRTQPKVAPGVVYKDFVLTQTFRRTKFGRIIPTYQFDKDATAAYQKHIHPPKQEEPPQRPQLSHQRTRSSGVIGTNATTPAEEREFRLHRRGTTYAHMAAGLEMDELRDYDSGIKRGPLR